MISRRFRPVASLLAVLLAPAIARAEGDVFLTVSPLADVRAEPEPVPPEAAARRPYEMDPLQETQIVYGEAVRILERREGWARIEAVEQPEFTHHQVWEGYPGWVKEDALVPRPEDFHPDSVVISRYAFLYAARGRAPLFEVPLGARLPLLSRDRRWTRVRRPDGSDGWIRSRDVRADAERPTDDAARRHAILKTAGLFLGEPYYWGGRAGHRTDLGEAPSGVDCSGLVNLAYRAAGVDVPRDSHEQFLKARPLSYAQLKPGDLIFLAKTESPDRIVHVMIFAGGDRAVEAVHEFNVVRKVTVKKKLGRPLRDIAPDRPAGGRLVRLGRLLPE